MSRSKRNRRLLQAEHLEPRVVLSTTYLISEIAPLPNTDSTAAADINNLGVVVGTSSRSGLTPISRAFQYDANNGVQDLGTFGGDNAGARAINDVGQVVGWAEDASGKTIGFRNDPITGVVDLGGVGTNAGVYPAGINNNGDVVGGTYYFGMGVGFKYTDADGITIVTPATNTAWRSATDINDAGVISVHSSARSWITGETWIEGVPAAINNANQGTGTTATPGQSGELFRYTPGVGQVNLGTLSGGHTAGLDINDAGDVVGYGKLSDGTSHALLFTDADGMVSLNHLIAPNSGWVLNTGTGINASGQIVGTGVNAGETRAFVLTPFAGVDNEAPLATVLANPITEGSGTSYTFEIAWWDRTAVDVLTLDNADVTVVAPDGTEYAAALESTDSPVEGIRRVATYSINAPGVAWGAKDNGTWRVVSHAGEVVDINGVSIAGGEIGTFDVDIEHSVTLDLTGPAIVQATKTVSFSLDALTTYSYDPDENFTFDIDWDSDGQVDQIVTGPASRTVDHVFSDDAGNITISATATDAQGLSSSAATLDVRITGAPGFRVWEYATSFSGAFRSGAAGVNWNGTLFVIGGAPFANGGEEGAVHSLAPAATAWQSRQHLDSGMLKDVGVGIGSIGTPIFFGGTLEGEATTKTFLYSTQDGKGDKLAAKTFAVKDFAFATDDQGRLYSIGGVGNATAVERYDSAADSWTTLAALPAERTHATAAYDGAGHILVIGGRDNSGASQATVFSYDIAADSWSQIADLPEAVSEGAAALGDDGAVYMLGGRRTDNLISNNVHIYNAAADQWIAGPELLTERYDFAIASRDGFIYAMGGANTETVERIDTNVSGSAPIAGNDTVDIAEDEQVTINVLANDSDLDGDVLSVSEVDSTGTAGSVAINADNTVTYTPPRDFSGTDAFNYTVTDPGGFPAFATVTIGIASDGLLTGADTAATDEDTVLNVNAPAVLENDSSETAGATLSIVSADSTSMLGATVTVNADGSFSYDPTAAARVQALAGADTIDDMFTYTMTDGSATEFGTVTVVITGMNDGPVANDDVVVVGYTIETVDFPGATTTTINGINNLGQVVGSYSDASGGHSFIYDGTTFTTIDNPDGNSIGARDINDRGVIVGGAGGAGFVYDEGNYSEVKYALRPTSFGGINNSDLAVGTYSTTGQHGIGSSHGLTYQNGQQRPLDHPDGATYARGTWLADANDAGLIVGSYYPSFWSRTRSFIYDGQNFTDVIVPGTTWNWATGINNHGEVVGMQVHGDGAERFGFVMTATGFETFKVPDFAGWTNLNDVNDAGVLVGGAAGHGFIAAPATSTDKDTVFVGRAISMLANDKEVDIGDSLSAVMDAVTSAEGATVRIYADGRFVYDPTTSTTLQALVVGDSKTDAFDYSVTDQNGATDAATVSIVVSGGKTDGSNPTASAQLSPVAKGAADYTFEVTYTDNAAINVATLDNNDIRVTGPNGFDVPATFVSVNDNTSGSLRIATYAISAPGGDWDGADNGRYTVEMQLGQVADVDGNAVAAQVIGAMDVAIDVNPSLALTAPRLAQGAELITLTMAATSSHPSDPTDVFTFDIDWENDGTVDTRLTGATGTLASHTYYVGGSYTIGVSVLDKHGNWASATHTIRITSYWQWEDSPGFNFARTGAAAVNLDGTILLLGGRPFSPDNNLDARADYLAPAATQWQQGPYLSGHIEGQGAGIDQLGRVVVIGGFEPGHGHAGDNYVYSLTEGKTSTLAVRAGSPFGFGYTTDDQNYIYTAGGVQISFYPSANDLNSTTFERYDANTDTWELLAPLPQARAYATAVYDGAGHILIIGGTRTRSGYGDDTIFTYDIGTNTWLDDPTNDRYYMPQLPTGLNGVQATLGADGLIYITGGSSTKPNYSSTLAQTYVLDPRTRALVNGPYLPNGHAYHAAALGADGHVYVIGGSTTPFGHNGYGQVSKLNTVGSAAPEFLSAPQRYALVGEAYSTGAFFKANPRPTYTLVDRPAGMSVDAQSGALLWTPVLAQVGAHQVTLQATNVFGTTEATFTVDVLEQVPDILAPTTPTNLRETAATDTSITLSWDAATDNREISHYKVYKYRKLNRWRSTWSLVADNITGTSYTIAGLIAGSGGKYSVAAVDTSGNESRRSASLSTTTNYAPTVYPLSPSNSGDFVYAIEGDGLYVGSSYYHFTPQPYRVTGRGKPAPTLSIVDSPTGVAVDQATGAVTWTPTAADIGPATITVRGTNSVGAGDFSFSFTVYPAGTDVNPPTTPSRITVANTTSAGGDLSWNAASDDYGVVGYRVKAKKSGTGNPLFLVADTHSTALTYTIDTLDANTRYTVYVTAYDAAGNESYLGTGPTFTTLNNVPTALHDLYDATEDLRLTIAAADGVLVNDSDPDGAPMTAVLAAAPAHGTVTLNADGSFTYSPSPNFNGRDSFTYRANDGRDNSNIASVTIDVAALDDAGLAEDDGYNVNKNTTLDVTVAAGLLANDIEVDGQTLTAVLVDAPANGAVTLNGDGSFRYVPTIDFNGIDTFTYKNNDGGLDSHIATVSITVGAPTAGNDAHTTNEDTELTIAAPGVLGNDADSEGDPLTTVLIDNPANGTLTLNANGSFAYTPDADFNGSDSFTYRATDGMLQSNLATVAITVNAVNDAPVAADDAYAVDEDTELSIATASGVLANDTDVDGDALTVTVVEQPLHGSLTLNNNGSFSYTPAANYHGSDGFTYRANDSLLDSNLSTVTITVNSVNDKPIAGADAYSVDEDNSLTVAAAIGLLSNDSDVEGDVMAALRVLNPSHGAVTLNADGSFSYTPQADFNGTDSFTYRANDGTVGSATASVTITVNAVNDAPVAMADSYTATQDNTLTINSAGGVLTNDSDVDGDALTTVVGDAPAHGTITLNANGSFDYVPHAGFNGSDSFTYQATDGTLATAAASVTITVDAATNNAPIAVNDSATTDKDAAVDVDVLANDTDEDGDSLSVTVVDNPTNGSVVVNTNSTVTYTPNAGFTGTDNFTYRASDGKDDSNLATVSIIVHDPASGTKFFVVDFTAKGTFEYDANGDLVENYNLAGSNTKPQGVASNKNGTTVWVVNKTGKVYVYDNAGTLQGSWTPSGPVKFDGIATDENDIWIVDRETDRVYRYIGAATRTSGTVAADSSFQLASKNKKAKGITTDGTHLWVVNAAAGPDKVFKYGTDGTLVGNWTIDAANSTPTGITIDPNNVDHIWIVDAGTNKVYQYDNAAGRTSGQQDSDGDWDLAETNVDPQGIADPFPAPTWNDQENPVNVDDDGVAAPTETSSIIGDNDQSGSGPLPPQALQAPYFDVNDDDFSSPRNALLAIRHFDSGAQAEGEARAVAAAAVAEEVFRRPEALIEAVLDSIAGAPLHTPGLTSRSLDGTAPRYGGIAGDNDVMVAARSDVDGIWSETMDDGSNEESDLRWDDFSDKEPDDLLIDLDDVDEADEYRDDR